MSDMPQKNEDGFYQDRAEEFLFSQLHQVYLLTGQAVEGNLRKAFVKVVHAPDGIAPDRDQPFIGEIFNKLGACERLHLTDGLKIESSAFEIKVTDYVTGTVSVLNKATGDTAYATGKQDEIGKSPYAAFFGM